MGGGSYSYIESHSRAAEHYSKLSSDSIFRSESRYTHKVASDMDIKHKVREARDNEDHPNSFPIIIALDVTGSMGSIPENLIKKTFPEMMNKIYEAGVPDPQVCFIGIGDTEFDDVPLQVGQFETNDQKLEHWLTSTYLEGGGGSNIGESYNLAWYFAARHTSTDSFEKRGKKGVLITIGDEPSLDCVHANDIVNIFGDQAFEGITSRDMLKEAQEAWDVYHINIKDYSGSQLSTQRYWSEILDEKHLITSTTQHGYSHGEDVADLIADIVIKSYADDENVNVVTNAEGKHTTSFQDMIETMLAAQLAQNMLNSGEAVSDTDIPE